MFVDRLTIYITTLMHAVHYDILTFIVTVCPSLYADPLSVIINVTESHFLRCRDMSPVHPSVHLRIPVTLHHCFPACHRGHSCTIIPAVFTWFDPRLKWHQPPDRPTDTSHRCDSFNLLRCRAGGCTCSPPDTSPPSPHPRIALATAHAGLIDLRYNLSGNWRVDSSIM